MIVSTEVVTVYDLERIGWKLELNTRGSVSEEVSLLSRCTLQ